MGKLIEFYVPEQKPISMDEFNKSSKVTVIPVTTGAPPIPAVPVPQEGTTSISILEDAIKEHGSNMSEVLLIIRHKDGHLSFVGNNDSVAGAEQLMHRMLFCINQNFWHDYDNEPEPNTFA